jgi:hypothetical protein
MMKKDVAPISVAGTLQRDPFFAAPEQFLPERRERRAQRCVRGATAV